MNQFSTLIIQNPSIKLQRDKNGKTYFLIRDQETGVAYFAFPDQVKRGWSDLATKFLKAQVILINLAEGEKVISLKVLTKRELRASKHAYLFRLKPTLFKILYP
jgi:hypothetical protein